jgi:hypothetical protein
MDHLHRVYQRYLGTTSATPAVVEAEQEQQDANQKMANLKSSLALALNELHVGPSNGETMEEICLAFDVDRNGHIDCDEFVAAALRPSPIEAWCKQIPWWHAIADAIPRVADCGQPLRAVALLTDAQIDVICAEVQKSIRSKLRTKALELSNSLKTMEKNTESALAGSKFATFATFKASVGNSEDFHKGLSGRVGTPPPPYILQVALKKKIM